MDTIFYTASVINAPSRIETDIHLAHERLMGIALRPLRLLTQIELVLEVNQLRSVSTEVVEAARDSLVIGQG
jgi:hypothetical protein